MISSVVTRGYGPGATISLVAIRGYTSSEVVVPPAVPQGGGTPRQQFSRRRWRRLIDAWDAEVAARLAAERAQVAYEEEQARRRKKRKTEKQEKDEKARLAIMVLAADMAARALDKIETEPFGVVLDRLDEMTAALNAMASAKTARQMMVLGRAAVSAVKALVAAYRLQEQEEEEISELMLLL
jgi:ribosomal protein S4